MRQGASLQGPGEDLFAVDVADRVGDRRVVKGRIKADDPEGLLGVVGEFSRLHGRVDMDVGQARAVELPQGIGALALDLPQVRAVPVGRHQHHSLDFFLRKEGEDLVSLFLETVPGIKTVALGREDPGHR